MDTILEKKVSIQPGILSSPIGQMSEQRYRKLMTFKATKEINDQPQFEPMSVAGGQGVFSVPPILVPAAPWCFSHLLPRKPLGSHCWRVWAASLELRISDPFPQLSAFSPDRGPGEATWLVNPPFHDRGQVETWTGFLLSHESCWYNKAEVILQGHDACICLLRDETHVHPASNPSFFSLAFKSFYHSILIYLSSGIFHMHPLAPYSLAKLGNYCICDCPSPFLFYSFAFCMY